MANKKLIGDYPAIGIRPIVDGRRGPMQLRESLEPQVMAMAEAAKKLFEENGAAYPVWKEMEKDAEKYLQK